MIQNLPSDIKPSIANKLNFRNLGRLSQVSKSMRNTSNPILTNRRNRQTKMKTNMMRLARMPKQYLALSTWNKDELAAYIAAYAGNKNMYNYYVRHLVVAPNGSIIPHAYVRHLVVAPNGSIIPHSVAVKGPHTRYHLPPGTVKPNVLRYLTQNADLTLDNRFRFYRALMKQNKPELIYIAKIVHGYNHNSIIAGVANGSLNLSHYAEGREINGYRPNVSNLAEPARNFFQNLRASLRLEKKERIGDGAYEGSS